MIRNFALGILLVGSVSVMAAEPTRSTAVRIVADKFLINDQPTYKGRTWNGSTIEGLLFNSRMVQATFDDRNPETRGCWAYPDTKTWDADRNTREFLAQMPSGESTGCSR